MRFDNRAAKPKNITDDNYNEKFDTISCPHCDSTLARRYVMPECFCYVCGGQFGKVVLKRDFYSDDSWLDALAGLED